MEELNRLIIKIPNRYGDTGYIWFVQEQDGNWSLISLGQEYELYREIGKRCALAESGNLLLPPMGRVTMEEYLTLCEQAVSNPIDTRKLYDYFKITISVSTKNMDSYRKKRMLEMCEVYKFEEVAPGEFEAFNPDPDAFLCGVLSKEHIQISYIGPILKPEALFEKQQSLF